MRIVHVNCVPDAYGRAPADLLAAWPTLHDVAAAVRGAGSDVAVVQAAHEPAVHAQDGIVYHFVRTARASRPWLSPPGPLAAAVRALAPDIVHLHGLDFPLHARALGAIGVPVLVQDHGSRLAARFRLPRAWGYRRAAGVAFTAGEQARRFVAAGHLRAGIRIFAVPESSTRFTPGDREAARAATGLDGDPALLWVGRLDSNKDPGTIVEAARRALLRYPNLRLDLCFGGDPLLPELRRRIEVDPVLAARVRLVGRVPHAEIESFCRAADFFLLGSAREGSGYALIEAIACGATPIVSDIAPFRALTGNGTIGRLVRRGDPEAFAAALIDLAGQPRAPLRAAARALFDAQLSFEVIGRALVDAYRLLLDEAHAA